MEIDHGRERERFACTEEEPHQSPHTPKLCQFTDPSWVFSFNFVISKIWSIFQQN